MILFKYALSLSLSLIFFYLAASLLFLFLIHFKMDKNLSSEIPVESFIENRAALFLTTPQLLSPLSLLSNDSGLIGNFRV
jgi:hypothetical protein